MEGENRPSDIERNAARYEWLRKQYACGEETYLAEGITSGKDLDEYIDGKMGEA
jgi:hypothetical protein